MGMYNLNQIEIMGNVVAIPEYNVYTGDFAVLTFRIATTESRKNKDTDQWEDVSDFFEVKCLGKFATQYKDKITKGVKTIIIGRLKDGAYKNKEGENRNRPHIVASKIFFMESKAQSEVRTGHISETGTSLLKKSFGVIDIKDDDFQDDIPF